MITSSKVKIKYVCQTCGTESAKWIGKCFACNAWNSFVEEIEREHQNKGHVQSEIKSIPVKISEIDDTYENRISTNISELDRLFGGGIVPGSFILIGGQPGIGKSTILLQMSYSLALQGKKILYVTGEESLSQIKSRAKRININAQELFVLSEVDLNVIVEHIKSINPDIVIIDSIQIVYRPDIPSSPGTVVQVRECSNILMLLAKTKNISIFVVGHVTKEGTIAGPKVLEHIVDAVFYFEGDRNYSFRILRAYKNRFGSTNEIAIFDMDSAGLKEVTNPSDIFLNDEEETIAGSVVVPSIEGSRSLLIELQALLSLTHNIGMTRRVSTFIDSNRVALLIAIFEKVLGVKLGNYDIFINLVGGIKIVEPALDLGIIVAMFSSLKNIAIKRDTVVLGEVGLGGEVRGVSHIEKRINEAVRLGFTTCVIPERNLKKMSIDATGFNLIGINSIADVIDKVFML